jgi:hypothetical protein
MMSSGFQNCVLNIQALNAWIPLQSIAKLLINIEDALRVQRASGPLRNPDLEGEFEVASTWLHGISSTTK